ncbi:type II toxin-antitoxin system HicA family toxin [Candidatus Peregrinibacteria bacterium]|jgi:hypothetical protein|nr:type II toxin-antitoxin system HicA family toxin [Candidatus Peregrinibacteria bacterium]
MSKKEKLLKKFFEVPIRTDLKFHELIRLMSHYGYVLYEREGSRVIFYNSKIKDTYNMHKPHASEPLKRYQVKDIQNILSSYL